MIAGTELGGPRVASAEEPPGSLVVLLHGWGANGDDLIGLAESWRAALPRTAFASPHGPEPHPAYPIGRQWFALGPEPILRGPGSAAGAMAAAALVNAFADAELARLGLPGSAVAFAGFSQGATVALAAGLTRPSGCAAIAAYSGTLAGGPVPEGHDGPRPPVLLVHGELDDVVPPDSLGAAVAALSSAGIDVQPHLIPGLGHGIDAEGVALGGTFLRTHLRTHLGKHRGTL